MKITKLIKPLVAVILISTIASSCVVRTRTRAPRRPVTTEKVIIRP